VTLLVALNEEMPFFTCAAASSYRASDAVEKALMELEAGIYCRYRDGPLKDMIKAENVFHPLDHGRLYEQKKNTRRALYLLGNDSTEISLKEVDANNKIYEFKDLCEQINNYGWSVYFAHINNLEQSNELSPYQVVKVIIPGTVPMTFGYGLEPFGLERMRSLPESCGIEKRRPIHKLYRFPHPFT
jgi:ribosomal protein S12 methylthiotransferase accessory factor YcaO